MRFQKQLMALFTVVAPLSLSLAGCAGPAPEATGPFKVLVSSEAAFLKPVLEKAIQEKGLEAEVTVGSGTVEMAETLTRSGPDASPPDAIAIVGANWLADTAGASVVGTAETIAWSPVVVGFKPGVASGATIPLTELETIVAKNPGTILAAQGNASDASILFWLGALSAKEGSGIVKEGQLHKPALDALFGSLTRGTVQIDETAGSLASQAQATMGKLKGVITYEAAIHQMNTQLDAAKKTKLQPTRLRGGTLSGMITLSFVGTSPKKKEMFQSVVQTLKGPTYQKAMQESGWLTAAPADVLQGPERGTLWAAKRRFERSIPKLAARTH